MNNFLSKKIYSLSVSKDREWTDTSASSGGGIQRFKNHSPSTRRRSRDRDRGSDKTRDIDISDLNMTGDTIDQFDESRLSDEMGYQSFTSEEVDQIGGSTIQLVQNDVGGGGGGGSSVGSGKHSHHSRSNSMQAFDRLNTKIACTRESIRKEQTARDDNVNEYLKLAANADKQQLHRIKAVFEKKNQKSAHTISQLQKKLDTYNKRVKEVQFQYTSKLGHNQSHQRQPREVLRDVSKGLGKVGGNIKDGITGLSGSVMSKPREFAHLIKNKFGSADNINQLSSKFHTFLFILFYNNECKIT